MSIIIASYIIMNGGGNEKIGLDELELLRDYARVFGKGTKYYFYIFSKGGFTEGLLQAAQRGEVTLVTLAELYN